MKACFKCDRSLPLDEFYKHPMMADGHLNKCKDCTKKDVGKDYHRKRVDPAWAIEERSRHRAKYYRLGYRTKYRKPRRGRKEFPGTPEMKDKARNALGNAVRDGKVIRPDLCQECGASGRIHGHHFDYSKPLDVMWLCTKCHGLQHRKAA